jgi:hypothetical protein
VAVGLGPHSKIDRMGVAGMCAGLRKAEQVVRMVVDIGGLGAGVGDRLDELGFGDLLEGVSSGEKPLEPDRYSNRRAEMWGQMGDWLKTTPCRIPDTDTLHSDLVGPGYKFDSNSRLMIDRKEDMKKRGLRSPDEADALALTFASPVNPVSAAFDPYKHFRRT